MANEIMSALGSVYRALIGKLTRRGVNVGGTASYPRVEVHSVIENAPLDKGSNIRTITCIVESISEEKMADVMTMNDENLTLLLTEDLGIAYPWQIVGIIPDQLRELTETSETNAILYRLLQNYTVYVKRITE